MHNIIREYEIFLEKVNLGEKVDAVAKEFNLAGDSGFGAGILEVRGGTYPLNSTKWDEVLYVIEGTISLLENGIEKVARKGDILWTPKGTKSTVIVKDYLKAFYVIRPFGA
jgi:ethanolamine utilization protein EutQ (cupin superfamily)